MGQDVHSENFAGLTTNKLIEFLYTEDLICLLNVVVPFLVATQIQMFFWGGGYVWLTNYSKAMLFPQGKSKWSNQ